MAIQLSRTIPAGLQLPAAYLRCVQVNIGADSTVHLVFNVYRDEAARRSGLPPVEQLVYDLPTVGEEGELQHDPAPYFSDAALQAKGRTPLERAYMFLKTLPAFAAGKDV